MINLLEGLGISAVEQRVPLFNICGRTVIVTYMSIRVTGQSYCPPYAEFILQITCLRAEGM